MSPPASPDAGDIYAALLSGGPRAGCDGFDAHVIACLLAIGVAEALAAGTPVIESLGLEGDRLAALVAEFFPRAAAGFAPLRGGRLAPPPADEACLRELLWRHATEASDLQHDLADMVARRCQRPNHLWQDLGLRSRKELSWLMLRHFEPLASRNRQDMKWKKFLYRQICADEGFRLCTAPICSECDDFEACFGAEEGRSLVALSAGRMAAPARL